MKITFHLIELPAVFCRHFTDFELCILINIYLISSTWTIFHFCLQRCGRETSSRLAGPGPGPQWVVSPLDYILFAMVLQPIEGQSLRGRVGRLSHTHTHTHTYIYYIYGPMVFRVSRVSVRSWEGRFPHRRFDGISVIFF